MDARRYHVEAQLHISPMESYLSGDPSGVAMPNPLASRFLPTFIVSQGSLSLMYSFVGLSISSAYLPLLVLTLRIPSSYDLTNTCFREFMNSHILL